MIVGNYNRENDLHIFCGLLFVCIMQLSTLFMPLGWLACLLVLFVVRGISKNYSILHNCSSCRIETAQAQATPMHRKGCPEIASEVICTVEDIHTSIDQRMGGFSCCICLGSIHIYLLHRHTRCQSGPRNSYLPIWPLRRDAAFADRMLEAPRRSRPFFLDEERRAEDLRERPVALVRLLAKKMRADPPSIRPTIA